MDKFDKLKLASSSFSERLMISGVQMTRIVSSKMKDFLNVPTPESKLVDEATMEESNWDLNVKICSMINNGEIDEAEIVKAIKKQMLGKSSSVSSSQQGLSLDLLEACTVNCDNVLSKVVSENVLEEMLKMIEDPKMDHGNRVKVMHLIRAWGEDQDLDYMPVFRHTYEALKTKELPSSEISGNTESYLEQQQLPSHPLVFPVPPMDIHNAVPVSSVSYSSRPIKEKNEILVITRNSLEILSSILNKDGEPKAIKEELTVSMYEKCKQYLPIIRNIIQSKADDEVMMFDAINLHEELQQITTRYEELAAAFESELPNNNVAEQQEGSELPNNAMQGENHKTSDKVESFKEEKTESSSVPNSSCQGLQERILHEAQS